MYIKGTFDMTQCMIIGPLGGESPQLADMLSAYGFDLTSAANANDALVQCDNDMPDVIVLPDNLQDMDAVAFIRRLRQSRKGNEAAVFLCAEKADSEQMGRAIWEGASDFLIEPFDAEVLDRKLKQAGVV